MEITAPDPDAGETAKIEVTDDGSATVYTGSSAHGQGHHTAWAMLVQDELGIPMDQITVIHGDTDLIPTGVGTYGSRSLQLGGSAVHKAAIEVKDEARRHAAEMLEAAEADVVLDTSSGLWQVRGDPDTALSWAQVAGHTSGGSMIADVSFVQERPTFPFGTHVSVVEVDTETGQARLLRHVAVEADEESEVTAGGEGGQLQRDPRERVPQAMGIGFCKHSKGHDRDDDEVRKTQAL